MNKTDSPALRELTFKWGETDNTQIDKYITCQMMIRAMKTNKAEIAVIFRDVYVVCQKIAVVIPWE